MVSGNPNSSLTVSLPVRSVREHSIQNLAFELAYFVLEFALAHVPNPLSRQPVSSPLDQSIGVLGSYRTRVNTP